MRTIVAGCTDRPARLLAALRGGAAAAAGDRGSGSRSAPGLVLVEGGFDYAHDILYPGVRAAGQSPARAARSASASGISSIAELQIDGGLYNTLDDHHPASAGAAGATS